jgi:Zn-dependent peptidase ImmA (M78 family)
VTRRRRDIEALAKSILLQHSNNTSAPVDPVRVANSMGLRVFNSKFKEPGIHGVIARRGTTATIYVDVDDKPVRKRFTVSHEIGHFVLHLVGGEGEFIDDDDTFRTTADPDRPWDEARVKEWEANVFAASFLMPEDLVRSQWAEITDVDGMAHWFQVSGQAMAIRLAELGLVD